MPSNSDTKIDLNSLSPKSNSILWEVTVSGHSKSPKSAPEEKFFSDMS